LKLSNNFACLPGETGKTREFEIDLRCVDSKANLSTDEEEKTSDEYIQKAIIHKNMK